MPKFQILATHKPEASLLCKNYALKTLPELMNNLEHMEEGQEFKVKRGRGTHMSNQLTYSMEYSNITAIRLHSIGP